MHHKGFRGILAYISFGDGYPLLQIRIGNCETDFSVHQRNLFSEKARLRLESNAAVLIKNSHLANFLKYRHFPTAFC